MTTKIKRIRSGGQTVPIFLAAALASMKYSSRASVASKAQSEARRYFEYEIDF